jgi:hypothetical protein
LPAGGAKAQPATVHGPATVAIGIPETITTGLGTVGIACPPWAHRTVAPICKIGAGIVLPYCPQANLSSRPERSAVERSTIFFSGSHADSANVQCKSLSRRISRLTL